LQEEGSAEKLMGRTPHGVRGQANPKRVQYWKGKEMPEEITGRYVTVDSTRIYYDECGDGIPFLCLHTVGASSLIYRYFMPIMARNGFRVIAPDYPGHGKSYPVNWEPIRNTHEHAEFMWKVTEAICDGEKPVVYGCAVGGDMALDMACYHSKGMLAAVVMEGACRTPTFPNVRELEEPHACPGAQYLIERAAITAMYYPCPEERVRELRWQHRFAGQLAIWGVGQCWPSQDCGAKLKDIKCPILVFKGEADYYVPEELIEETMAGIPEGLAERYTGKKVGHYPMFEEPEYTAEVVMEFLKRKTVV